MFGENFLSDFLSSLLIAIIMSVLGIGGYKIYIDKKHIKKTKIEASQKNLKQENEGGGSNIIQNIQRQDITLIVKIYQDSSSQKPVRISSTESTVTGTVPEIISPEKKPQE